MPDSGRIFPWAAARLLVIFFREVHLSVSFKRRSLKATGHSMKSWFVFLSLMEMTALRGRSFLASSMS